MKRDLFEELRLLCYSKAEVAKLIGISRSRIYAISTGTKILSDGEREKILQIIAGGKNKKYLKRAFDVQKHVVKQNINIAE